MLKLVVICVYCCALQPLFAGTEINNGGAGISINGEVATFYSAQLKVNPTPLTDVPSLKILTNLIRKLNIPANIQIELSENITPSFDRNYYAVSQEDINQATLQQIKEEYSKITKTPIDQITIFALTDPAKKITLLLPDFFKLNESEKVAILFHESLWISNRVKNYAQMLEIEKDMQVYSMYPTECVPRYNLTKKIESLFNQKFWSLNAIFRCQTEKYRLYSNAGSVFIADFFNSAETNTFAEIILASLTDRLPGPELYELFLKQINEPANLKTFLESKRALTKALQDNELAITVSFKNHLFPLESPYPASQNNVDNLSQMLATSELLYGFLDDNFFEMTISNSTSPINIKLVINYKNK